jgi:hypothetical protein
MFNINVAPNLALTYEAVNTNTCCEIFVLGFIADCQNKISG